MHPPRGREEGDGDNNCRYSDQYLGNAYFHWYLSLDNIRHFCYTLSMENKTTATVETKEYKGRKWTHDGSHTGHLGGGCFTCENIRTGIDHRISLGIEKEGK